MGRPLIRRAGDWVPDSGSLGKIPKLLGLNFPPWKIRGIHQVTSKFSFCIGMICQKTILSNKSVLLIPTYRLFVPFLGIASRLRHTFNMSFLPFSSLSLVTNPVVRLIHNPRHTTLIDILYGLYGEHSLSFPVECVAFPRFSLLSEERREFSPGEFLREQ